MARVFRHKYPKRTPDGRKVRVPCRKWYIAYVDADGRRRKEPGFTDKRATEERANEIQKRIDRQKAGILDSESLNLTAQLTAPIEDHVRAYETFLKAQNVSDWHLSETMRRLKYMTTECGFNRLADIKADPVQAWVAIRNTTHRGARTTNTYLSSLRAFVRWGLKTARLTQDPLVTVSKLDEAADKRRDRRALTEDELNRLLRAAAERPAHDLKVIRRGKRTGQLEAKVSEETLQEAEHKGRHRRLMYLFLVLTGLRKGELEQLKWSDIDIDDKQSWLTVRAAVSKNSKTETIPIREDLAKELRAWRDDSKPQSDDSTVFNVPRDLVRILDRDLVAAGIAKRIKGEDGKWKIDKRDSRGKTLDVHALRHTTATFLAKSGVAPRTAQCIR